MSNQSFEQFIGFQEEIRIRRVYVNICKDLRAGAVLGYIVAKFADNVGLHLLYGSGWLCVADQPWWQSVGLKDMEVFLALGTLEKLGFVRVRSFWHEGDEKTYTTIELEKLAEALSNG